MIEPEDLEYGLSKLSEIYSPYLGIILMYYFGKPNSETQTPKNMLFPIHIIALISSIVWNCLITFLIVRIFFTEGLTVQESFRSANFFVSYFPWIVSIPLGYYFVSMNAQDKVE
jgi:hypothetical protein